MRFIFNNELLEAQIKQIKQQIRLSMNGVVVDVVRCPYVARP